MPPRAPRASAGGGENDAQDDSAAPLLRPADHDSDSESDSEDKQRIVAVDAPLAPSGISAMDAKSDSTGVQLRESYRDLASSSSSAGGGVHRHADGRVVQYKVYKRRWFGLGVLMALNLVISWSWLSYAPVADSTQKWFDLASETPVNWLSTVVLFSYPVASPATVYTLSKYGVSRSIAAASFLVLAGNWVRYAGARTQTFGATMFGQILIGFAQPFVLTAPTYYSDMWFTPSGRITATALVSLSNPLGAALGELINPFWCIHAGDIPNMTLYIAILTTAACLPWVFVPARPPTPPCASSALPKPGWRESWRIVRERREFWIVLVLFTIYLGFFNALSSLLNQIMLPYGYSADNAGITGALLIVVGLVASAVVSPILDRTKKFLLAIRVCVPVIGACYLAFIWAPTAAPGNLAPPFVVAAVLGAASFSLLPLALEYVVEQTWPAAPEVSSGLLWAVGNLFGGVFLCIMDALRQDHGTPKANMKNSLIFEAVVACVGVPLIFLLRDGGLRRGEVDRREGTVAAEEMGAGV